MARETNHLFLIHIMQAVAFARDSSQERERRRGRGRGGLSPSPFSAEPLAAHDALVTNTEDEETVEEEEEKVACRCLRVSKNSKTVNEVARYEKEAGRQRSILRPSSWLRPKQPALSSSCSEKVASSPVVARLKWVKWGKKGRREQGGEETQDRSSSLGSTVETCVNTNQTAGASPPTPKTENRGGGTSGDRGSEAGNEESVLENPNQRIAGLAWSAGTTVVRFEEDCKAVESPRNDGATASSQHRLEIDCSPTDDEVCLPDPILAAAEAAAGQAALAAYVATFVGDVAGTVVEAIEKGIKPEVAVSTAAETIEYFKTEIQYAEQNNRFIACIAAASPTLRSRLGRLATSPSVEED